MTDSKEKLSERLREQVAALHAPEGSLPPALGRDAQLRVVQSLAREAVQLERQRRQRAWLGGSAGALLAAAAGIVLFLRGNELQPAAAPQAKAPEAEPCRLPLMAADGFAGEAGTKLALGALGELVTQPETQVSVESSSACELVLRLRSGTLAGDLHSLRPARLLIRTEHGEVVVTGTRFSVRSDAELEVLLENGVVDVQLQGAGKLRLQPGTRLHKHRAKPSAEREDLSNADVKRLAGLLEPPKPAPPAAAEVVPEVAVEPVHKPAPAQFESSDAALRAAEAARRAQRWASAREAYRFASSGKDSGAEVALLRFARFELDQSAPASALRLTAEHKRRFARTGVLQADAGFIEVQARKALGQTRRAESAARALIDRYPDTPQAAAARKLLEQSSE